MQIPERQAELDALLAKHFSDEDKQPEANGTSDTGRSI